MTQHDRTADNYYLNYFQQMIKLVDQRYHDILNQEQVSFITKVLNASEPAIRLLVRLYLRKGPNFLINKLSYPEVPDIQHALNELEHLGLIETNPTVYCYELIELLPIAVSRRLFSEDPKCRKVDLIEAWFDDESLNTCTDWGIEEPIISPCHYDEFRRIQLLYFGNERQTLTEFILEDIGLFSYESYQLDIDNRLFNHESEIEALIELNDLRTEFYLMNEAKDWENLLDFSNRALQLKLPERLKGKQHKLINQVAFRLEQQAELDNALALFKTNEQPPARERIIRIYFKQEKFKQALLLLQTIELSPLSSDEQQFYNRFINKTRKKLKLPPIEVHKPEIPSIDQSWINDGRNVEAQAVDFFGNAVWLENNLPLAVFGLIFWPIIFADIPGVWHHPFQSAPTDLTEPEFNLRRAAALKEIKSQTKAQWQQSIEDHWNTKQNIRNPFVHWKSLTLDWVLRCFNALSHSQWQGLFTHLLADIRKHRSGFPDLFQEHEGTYRFIEIKGPGDKLQDNQIQWIGVFRQLNINIDVCYVKYLHD